MNIKEDVLKAIPNETMVIIDYLQKRLSFPRMDIQKTLKELTADGELLSVHQTECSECLRRIDGDGEDFCIYCGADFEEDAMKLESTYYKKSIK